MITTSEKYLSTYNQKRFFLKNVFNNAIVLEIFEEIRKVISFIQKLLDESIYHRLQNRKNAINILKEPIKNLVN